MKFPWQLKFSEWQLELTFWETVLQQNSHILSVTVDFFLTSRLLYVQSLIINFAEITFQYYTVYLLFSVYKFDQRCKWLTIHLLIWHLIPSNHFWKWLFLAKKYLHTKTGVSMPVNSWDINNLSCCHSNKISMATITWNCYFSQEVSSNQNWCFYPSK